MWRTPATLRGTLDDVPNAAPALILALETSCDDTCAAVVSDDGAVRANVVSSQGVHDRFGGVVPEIASRHHLELVNAVVDDALRQAGATLDDVTRVAVTQGPGLVGALLIGVATAKGLAAARRLPLLPVDHLQGHVAANFLAPDPIEPPFLCLIASGGHTLLVRVTDHRGYEILGRTLDDAAGEAFDKGARLLGLGYPGGPALSRLALDGDPSAFAFPTAARVPAWTSRSPGSRPRCSTPSATWGRRRRRAAPPISPPPTSTRSSRRSRRASSARCAAEPGARLAIGGGVAANRRLRERAGGARRRGQDPAAGAVHRQRGDDRLRRPLGRAGPVPGLPRAGRVRHAPAPRCLSRGGGGAKPPGRGAGAVRRGAPRAAPRRGGDPRRRARALVAGVVLALRARRPGEPPPRALADAVPYDGRSPARAERPRHARDRRPAAPVAGRRRDRRPRARSAATCDSLEDESGSLRSALGARGVQLADVVTYTRTFNGFAATVRTSDLADLPSLGVRAQPVRRFYPAASEPARAPGRARRPPSRRSAAPRSRCSTPASTRRTRCSRTGWTRATTPSTATTTRPRRATRAAAGARRAAPRSPGPGRGGGARAADPRRRRAARHAGRRARGRGDDRPAARRARARRRPRRRRRHRRPRPDRRDRRQLALRGLRRARRRRARSRAPPTSGTLVIAPGRRRGGRGGRRTARSARPRRPRTRWRSARSPRPAPSPASTSRSGTPTRAARSCSPAPRRPAA